MEPDKAYESAKSDQAPAQVADTVPPTLKRFYDNCVAQGFDEMKAFTLTVRYLSILFGKGD